MKNLYRQIALRKKWCMLFLSALCLIGIPSVGIAQRISVKGKITDASDNTPLVGASVLVKSTSNGTVTDVNGEFTLEVDPGATLVFTYIGYTQLEQTVTGTEYLNITLKPDAQSLQEVVVVGFGVQKKVNLSGAVDVIDSKVFEDRPVATLAQGLQGTVANLNIDFLSGEPGGTPNINIRGVNSINGGGPLIIIDGVPVDATELNYLAPADIKSVSILKDASSAAIYGARASYGVMLITTKTGVKDGISVAYSNNFSFGRPTVLPNKITDPYIYSRMLETSTDNTPWDYVNYSDSYYDWARERSNNPASSGPVRINPLDPTLYEYMGDRDWTKYFLDNTTFSQRQYISLSGKSGNTNYYVSGAYDNQAGALKVADDKFDRYSLRSKINFKPAPWLTLGNNSNLALTKRDRPSYLSIFDLYNLFPTDWDQNPNGTWANNEVGRTMARLIDGGKYTNDLTMFQTTFSGELSFFDRMIRLNSEYSIRRESQNINDYRTKYKIGFGPNDLREEGVNAASRTAGFENYSVLNTYATFEKAFNKHAVNVVVGYNQEYYRSELIGAARANIISASLPSIQLATGIPSVSETVGIWAVRGVFYRLNYTFNDKYIVEFNGRVDGSSRFPSYKRRGIFPSASAAWRLDKENFWEPLSGTVNQFKIRASYGSLGNQSVKDFGYLPLMGTRPGSYLIGGTLPQVVTSPNAVSSNYTWEEVSTKNIGFDIGLFDQRISASVDFYNRATTGMLTQGKELPNVFGTLEPSENAADLETKGWELSLGYDDDFSIAGRSVHFGAKITLADSRTYITKFDNPSGSLLQYYEGMELGEIWGLKSDGFFQTQEQIDALDQSSIIPWGALSIVPGWPRYQDLDGNGAIEKGTTVNDPKDLSKIGNITPRYRFGLNLTTETGGFDFRIFLQGVGKMDYYPLHYLYWGFYQQPYAGGYEHLLDYYRATSESDIDRQRHSQSYLNAGLADANTDAHFPILQSWLADRNLGERIDQAQGLVIPQTQYMQNAAYLRLKNVTIGYSLPQRLIQRYGISKFRVYASGENITEWSSIKAFYDPEAVTDNINRLNPGLSSDNSGWGYAYPFQRRISFGIDVTF